MVPSIGKDLETMTTHKTFKRTVRSRMAKTGESYTAARHQLLRRTEPAATAESDAAAPATEATAAAEGPAPEATAATTPTSDAALRRATGRGYDDWFLLLDDVDARSWRHPEIAAWLRSEHAVAWWWAQTITVGYERARGLRAVHQVRGGYSVSVTRTIAADAADVLAAFTSEEIRRRWLPDAVLEPRPTRAAGTARFDWDVPPSRLVVYVDPKASTRTVLTVQHERLPDAGTAERLKAEWRERLTALRTMLEAPTPAD